MTAGDDNKAFDDINITPMVDLYLVLLLIFIIMTTAGVQGTKVDLPKGSKAPAIGGPKSKAITINNEGKVFLDTVPVTLAELETKLTDYKAKKPGLPCRCPRRPRHPIPDGHGRARCHRAGRRHPDRARDPGTKITHGHGRRV